MSQIQAPFPNMIASLEDALRTRPMAPGFVAVPAAPASGVDLPPWFIDRCRRAYLSIPFDRPERVVGITSATHGEGKTLVSIGIAMALAADTQEPTLIQECEL